MVNDFEVIHMGGRTYNPILGRFMQADPFVQAPGNLQNYNRYSYVLNNPMSYTDPSGYFFKKLLNKAFSAINKVLGDFAPLVSIGLSIWAPWGTGFWASVGTGFVAGGVATGSLRGALTGAFTAGIFHGIGTHFQGLQDSAGVLSTGARIGKTLAHGVAGGISSVLNGGKFGHGFASAGFTQAFSGAIDKIGGRIGNITKGDYFSTVNRTMRIVASAVVGGTASAMTGGKFANGAITGAFSRGFNDEAHFQYEQKSFARRFYEGAKSFVQDIWAATEHAGKFYYYGGCAAISGSESCVANFNSVYDDAARIGSALFDYYNDPQVYNSTNQAVSEGLNYAANSTGAKFQIWGRVTATGTASLAVNPLMAPLGIAGSSLRASQAYGNDLTIDKVLDSYLGRR
jgi:RHS repeat-associated protein